MTALGYPEGLRRILGVARREMTVSVPLVRDNGEVEVFTGYRVKHSIARGLAEGAIRYSTGVNLDEVHALAISVHWRCGTTLRRAAMEFAVGGVSRAHRARGLTH